MNSIEFWAMNNPIRGLIQRYYEVPRLKRLSSGQTDSILEIGCGQGLANAEFLQGDASSLAFGDESFDLVVDFETETYEEKPVGFYYFWGKATKTA